MMKTKAIKTPEHWKQLSFHPLSELLDLDTSNLDGMVAHMKQHGYDEDEAIVIHEGLILDGRLRFAACKKAGVIPVFREFCGKNAFAYVAKKLFRQYPSVAERAKLAAMLAKMPGAQNTSNDGFSPLTIEEAAKAVGVSKSSVERAKAKAGRTKRRGKKDGPKVGGIIFAFKDIYSPLGQLVRLIDKFGSAYKCKETPAAEGLRRLLEQFRADFKRWAEFKMKQTLPE